MYSYMYMYMCLYVACMRACLSINMHVCVDVRVHVNVCDKMHVRMYLSLHARLYVCQPCFLQWWIVERFDEEPPTETSRLLTKRRASEAPLQLGSFPSRPLYGFIYGRTHTSMRAYYVHNFYLHVCLCISNTNIYMYEACLF